MITITVEYEVPNRQAVRATQDIIRSITYSGELVSVSSSLEDNFQITSIRYRPGDQDEEHIALGSEAF